MTEFSAEPNESPVFAGSNFKTARGLSPFAQSSEQKGTVPLSETGFETASSNPPANQAISSTRQKWAIGLWTAQVLATVTAVAACAAEIHSILFTGPALTLAGLALAVVARPLCSWSVLGYSLSAPLISAIGAVSIAMFRWGPDEAEDPILAILFLYAFVAIPAALIVFPQLLNWSILPRPGATFPWQFSLKSLLLITTSVCVVVTALRFVFATSTLADYLVFSLFVVVTMSLVAYCVFIFVAGRRSQ
jgi:hypothetical protein